MRSAGRGVGVGLGPDLGERGGDGESRITAADQYRTLFETLPLGVVYCSADGLVLEVNPAATQILGTESDELLTWPSEWFLDAVGEDRTPLRPADHPVKAALRTGAVVADVVLGLPHARTGELYWLEVTAVPCSPDAAGRPQRAYCMFRDVTEQRRLRTVLRESAELMSRLREANVLGVTVAEDGRLVEANDAYLEIVGYTRDDMTDGRITWQAITPPEWAAASEHALAELRLTGAFRPFEKEFVHRKGHRVPVLVGGAVLGHDPLRWTSYVMDLSARQRAEQERAALAARERAALAEAEIAGERLGFLMGVGELVSAATDRHELLSRAAKLVVPGLADVCVAFLPDAGGLLRATAVAYRGPAGNVAATDLRDCQIRQAGALLVQAAWETGSVQLKKITPQSRAKRAHFGSPLEEIMTRADPACVLAVPLTAGDRPLGVITLGRGADRPCFADSSDIPMAAELGRQLGAALANADKSAWDHAVAQALQHAVLPDSLPQIAGLDIAACYLPSTRDLDVGGDWYDAFPLDGGRVGLVIGDVAGHDIAAASVMAQVRNLLRAYAVERSDPAAVLRATAAALAQLLPDALATAAYAILDPRTGELSYACAGHLPPVYAAPSGQVSYLDGGPGTMLGVPGSSFTTGHRRLDQGGTLLFYTDGLVEDRSRDIGEGQAKLAGVMALGAAPDGQPGRSRTAEQTCAAVQAIMLGSAPRADDVSLLAARLARPRPRP
jgi:PAS domain S-box-containing protein